MRSERDRRQAENKDFLSDPDIISDGQAPRERDIDSGADDDAVTQLSAKEAKQPGPKP